MPLAGHLVLMILFVIRDWSDALEGITSGVFHIFFTGTA
jgi:hypothetical protein